MSNTPVFLYYAYIGGYKDVPQYVGTRMSLNIKNPEADRLARELAARTGESITQAVVKALRERFKRECAKAPLSLKDEIMAIGRRAAALPRRTGKTPDEIIDYDERGVPR